MNSLNFQGSQRGIALVVSLLFLLVVTIISVTAARNSTLSLKMASNMQDQNNSLQSTEAGLFGALALATTADDPFVGGVTSFDPFSIVNPLTNLNEQNSVTARVTEVYEGGCPRPRPGRGGFNATKFACVYYRVDAEHDVTARARTKASLGVVKPVFAGQ
jgi:type IV pilus assembly protein PilX